MWPTYRKGSFWSSSQRTSNTTSNQTGAEKYENDDDDDDDDDDDYDYDYDDDDNNDNDEDDYDVFFFSFHAYIFVVSKNLKHQYSDKRCFQASVPLFEGME